MVKNTPGTGTLEVQKVDANLKLIEVQLGNTATCKNIRLPATKNLFIKNWLG